MFFPSLSRPCFSSTVSPPVRRNTDREKTTHGEKNLMANSEGEWRARVEEELSDF
jgi:hypothetical protein